jgi:hypothetical protein
VNTNSTATDREIDDLADRIGRLATDEMLVVSVSERATVAIGGALTADMILYAAQDHLDPDAFAGFVERLRDGVARLQKQRDEDANVGLVRRDSEDGRMFREGRRVAS